MQSKVSKRTRRKDSVSEESEESGEQAAVSSTESQIDEDALSCCLADIDEVLDIRERDKALREFAGLSGLDEEDLESFNTRWSFLGLVACKQTSCCQDVLALYEDGTYSAHHNL